MNKICVVILLALLSCKEVTFREPQPKGKRSLTLIPKSLRGKYLTLQANGEPSKDTVIISAHGYHFGYFDPADRAAKNDQYEEGVLSDTLVLKSHKGYYFLNLNQNPEWLLRVLKQDKNGDLTYMAMDQKDSDFNQYLKKLSAEIRIDSVKNDDETLYYIDPSPAKLIELINKGFFSQTKLKKIK